MGPVYSELVVSVSGNQRVSWAEGEYIALENGTFQIWNGFLKMDTYLC